MIDCDSPPYRSRYLRLENSRFQGREIGADPRLILGTTWLTYLGNPSLCPSMMIMSTFAWKQQWLNLCESYCHRLGNGLRPMLASSCRYQYMYLHKSSPYCFLPSDHQSPPANPARISVPGTMIGMRESHGSLSSTWNGTK